MGTNMNINLYYDGKVTSIFDRRKHWTLDQWCIKNCISHDKDYEEVKLSEKHIQKLYDLAYKASPELYTLEELSPIWYEENMHNCLIRTDREELLELLKTIKQFKKDKTEFEIFYSRC